MTFWTFLTIIIASGPMEGTLGGQVAYPTEAECNDAKNIVTSTLSYDYLVSCIPKPIPSSSRRPQRRGE